MVNPVHLLQNNNQLHTQIVWAPCAYIQGYQPPTFWNIESKWERDDRWCHNVQPMMSFVQKILVDSDRHKLAMTQNDRKRCCWYCNF